jgi:3-oxoacyl-[acyl-carrier-protein] synthase II
MTDPHPEGLGVSTCIELALADAGIERDEVRQPIAGAHQLLLLDLGQPADELCWSLLC